MKIGTELKRKDYNNNWTLVYIGEHCGEHGYMIVNKEGIVFYPPYWTDDYPIMNTISEEIFNCICQGEKDMWEVVRYRATNWDYLK